MNEKKYYIAYGSNLSVEQMAQRCPDARIVGQAVLEDWELAFHGCATILPNKGKNTPVLVWEISAGDEKNLDIYEGFPHYYRKENMTVEVVSKDAEPMTVTAPTGPMTSWRCTRPWNRSRRLWSTTVVL